MSPVRGGSAHVKTGLSVLPLVRVGRCKTCTYKNSAIPAQKTEPIRVPICAFTLGISFSSIPTIQTQLLFFFAEGECGCVEGSRVGEGWGLRVGGRVGAGCT